MEAEATRESSRSRDGRAGRRKRSESADDGQKGEKKQMIEKEKSGKWYESSIAAERGRFGSNVSKMKKCGYHHESASRVGAVSPYNSFSFFLASESGEVTPTNDMAISLANFCRLCTDIGRVHKSDYDEDLADDCSALFETYIGQTPSKEAISSAIEKGWVILPSRLEEMKAANESEKKKKKESKKESESSTKGNSAPIGSATTSSGSRSNAFVGDDRSSISESKFCVGLRSEKVSEGAEHHPTYCRENFDYCKGGFRSKNCLLLREGSMDEESVSSVLVLCCVAYHHFVATSIPSQFLPLYSSVILFTNTTN